MENVILGNTHLNNLDKNKPVVLALSGGVDSMVLFALLKKANFKVIIAHVNHHKRAESLLEEKYILSLKDDNTIVEVFNYYHEKDNFQADAHKKRYEFFYKVAKKYDATAIITAHHYVDNLETILMNLIKGSNIYGYAGIKEKTFYNDILVIRPLLSKSKEEIYEYAYQNKIKFFEDSSNQSDDYLRNRIRHHVIPLLQQENPSLSKSITNYSTQLFDAFEYIRENTIKYVKENDYQIDISSFNKLALIQKKDIINYIFEYLGVKSSEKKINDVLRVIDSPKPNLSYVLSSKYTLIKQYNACLFCTKVVKTNTNTSINKNEEFYVDGYGTFKLEDNFNDVAKETLKVSYNEPLPLTIRNRKNGDKLIIGSGHKKLKDFLIDKKVPTRDRDKLIIVTNANDEIIWVLGYYKKACEEKNYITLVLRGE